MNYQEAEELAYKSEWAAVKCGRDDADNCWCRLIVPKVPIKFKEDNSSVEQEFYFVPSGSIDKRLAEHIVDLHNKSLKQTI